MPRLDGLTVMWRLRSEGLAERTPVVFLSGKRSAEDRARGLALGVEDHIVKPFDPRELLIRVRRVVNRPGKPFAHSRGAPLPEACASLSGTLGDLLVNDLVQFFNLTHRDGVVDLTADGDKGEILFRKGEVVSARIAARLGLEPDEAFLQMVLWNRGTFECRLCADGDGAPAEQALAAPEPGLGLVEENPLS